MTFSELKDKALSLPLLPGVYLMMDKTGTVIYVGKAKALKNRVSQYFHDQASHNRKTRAMVSQIDHFDTIVAGSEFEALVLECSLIKRYQPHYNILLKDDKGYPFIRLNLKDAYPDFSIVGRPAEDGARYFGPFGARHDTQAIIDALRTALHLPACGKKFPRDRGRGRPCLNFDMNRCDGYCRASMPQSAHAEAIGQAVRLLEGKLGELESELTEQMQQAAENLEFERAAVIRDRLKAITLLGKRQKVVAGYLADTDAVGLYIGQVRCVAAVLHFRGGDLVGRDTEFLPYEGEPPEEILAAFLAQYYGRRGLLPQQVLLPLEPESLQSLERMLSDKAQRRVELFLPQRGGKRDLIRMAEENAREECERVTTRQERTARTLVNLQELLGLPEPPGRIEAYDISNTGASDIVAAMTVFEDGRPKKREYRCFMLKGLTGPDDYGSMEQVLTRRFARDQAGDTKFASGRPDLLLIDGGANHAAVAERVLAQFGLHIPVYGMVKDDRHRTRALEAPDGREVGLQHNPALFAFVGTIQEETHNTAVGFHHKRHSKSTIVSELEGIPGIGETRRKALLRAFGSAKKIRQATPEELRRVLPAKAAEAVFAYYHTHTAAGGEEGDAGI